MPEKIPGYRQPRLKGKRDVFVGLASVARGVRALSFSPDPSCGDNAATVKREILPKPLISREKNKKAPTSQ